MNMKMSYLGVGAAVVVGLAFFLWQSSMPKPVATTEEAMIAPAESALRTVITLGTQNNLGQSGEAVITANGAGMAVVTLSLTGGTFASPQPAHIHEGSCPNPGKVTYPLTNVVGGTSETTLEVSYNDLMAIAEPLAINVHKSAAEASTYTACGDIE